MDRRSFAKQEAAFYKNKNPGYYVLLEKIAEQPQAMWLTGGEDFDKFQETITDRLGANCEKCLPTFVIYNIPNRDLGSYSAGGAPDAKCYEVWINRLAQATRHLKAIFIVEPDALAHIKDIDDTEGKLRISLIRHAAGCAEIKPVCLRVY